MVHVWYALLASPELHIQRVQARVAAGGHAIAEPKIRTRYVSSRAKLIRLKPHLSSLRVYDNSAEADPKTGQQPRPLLLLHMLQARIASLVELDQGPQWAKPILATALELLTTIDAQR